MSLLNRPSAPIISGPKTVLNAESMCAVIDKRDNKIKSTVPTNSPEIKVLLASGFYKIKKIN